MSGSEAVDTVIDQQVTDLASAGTWLTGTQRVAVAGEARAADGATDTPPDRRDPMLAAAHRIATAPATITEPWIDQLEANGLDRLAYVEVVGIVARLAAIDTYVWAAGRPPLELPEPVAGEPSRQLVDGARQRSAWVPIAGGARATTTVSAVAAEARARATLSAMLYLDDDLVGTAAQGGGDRGGLRRAQVEVVAARVSYRNDCFY